MGGSPRLLVTYLFEEQEVTGGLPAGAAVDDAAVAAAGRERAGCGGRGWRGGCRRGLALF